MRKKFLPLFVCMLFFVLLFPMQAFAGDEENPEIQDENENDVVDYLDIISAWFYEDAQQPEYLFIGLKVQEINNAKLKQKLTVHWEYNGIECAAGLAIGYGSPWFIHSAGWGRGLWFQEHYQRVNGTVDEEAGIVTFKIPKEYIKNPQKGDVLTNTYAYTFQRFGFLGRIGFDRGILRSLISLLVGKNLKDFAPDDGYGSDYVIKY
jgi:hypothetical protein